MSTCLLHHGPECTGSNPCASCEAVKFLRRKLTDEDFETFLHKIRLSFPPNNGLLGKVPTTSLDASIEILEVSPKAIMLLRRGRITTIGKLVRSKESELLEIVGMGNKTLREIKESLEKIGRGLR